jgi:uncharacterized membrane protein YjjB (DUF3815 family)
MGASNYILLFGAMVFSSAIGAFVITVLDLLRRKRIRESSTASVIPIIEGLAKSPFARPQGRTGAA